MTESARPHGEVNMADVAERAAAPRPYTRR